MSETESPRRVIFDLAINSIKNNDGDYQVALGELELTVIGDPVLTRYVVREGLQRILNDAARSGRLSKSRDGQIQTAVKEFASRPLVHWRLDDGTMLGKATRPQLISAAEHLERVAGGFLSRAIFYRRMAARLGDDKTRLSKVLKDNEILDEYGAAEAASEQFLEGVKNA